MRPRSGTVLGVIVASILGNAFLALCVVLAGWSLWWILRGALTNVDERTAEVEARKRVAEGGGWDEGPAPVPFTDEEMQRLSDALTPAASPEEAGIEARPRPAEPSRWRRPNTR